MFPFSIQTQKSLLNAGWYAGRKINIEQFRNTILTNNYELFPSVKEFLSEFGNLYIKFIIRNGMMSDLHFNVIQAVEEVDPGWAQRNYYERLGKRNICAIGQAHSDHMTIYMDEPGNVYGGFDDYFSLIANSGEAAIEAFCTNQSFKEIR